MPRLLSSQNGRLDALQQVLPRREKAWKVILPNAMPARILQQMRRRRYVFYLQISLPAVVKKNGSVPFGFLYIIYIRNFSVKAMPGM